MESTPTGTAALVTGASSGIGAACFAPAGRDRHLCARGVNGRLLRGR